MVAMKSRNICVLLLICLASGLGFDFDNFNFRRNVENAYATSSPKQLKALNDAANYCWRKQITDPQEIDKVYRLRLKSLTNFGSWFLEDTGFGQALNFVLPGGGIAASLRNTVVTKLFGAAVDQLDLDVNSPDLKSLQRSLHLLNRVGGDLSVVQSRFGGMCFDDSKCKNKAAGPATQSDVYANTQELPPSPDPKKKRKRLQVPRTSSRMRRKKKAVPLRSQAMNPLADGEDEPKTDPKVKAPPFGHSVSAKGEADPKQISISVSVNDPELTAFLQDQKRQKLAAEEQQAYAVAGQTMAAVGNTLHLIAAEADLNAFDREALKVAGDMFMVGSALLSALSQMNNPAGWISLGLTVYSLFNSGDEQQQYTLAMAAADIRNDIRYFHSIEMEAFKVVFEVLEEIVESIQNVEDAVKRIDAKIETYAKANQFYLKYLPEYEAFLECKTTCWANPQQTDHDFEVLKHTMSTCLHCRRELTDRPIDPDLEPMATMSVFYQKDITKEAHSLLVGYTALSLDLTGLATEEEEGLCERLDGIAAKLNKEILEDTSQIFAAANAKAEITSIRLEMQEYVEKHLLKKPYIDIEEAEMRFVVKYNKELTNPGMPVLQFEREVKGKGDFRGSAIGDIEPVTISYPNLKPMNKSGSMIEESLLHMVHNEKSGKLPLWLATGGDLEFDLVVAKKKKHVEVEGSLLIEGVPLATLSFLVHGFNCPRGVVCIYPTMCEDLDVFAFVESELRSNTREKYLCFKLSDFKITLTDYNYVYPMCAFKDLKALNRNLEKWSLAIKTERATFWKYMVKYPLIWSSLEQVQQIHGQIGSLVGLHGKGYLRECAMIESGLQMIEVELESLKSMLNRKATVSDMYIPQASCINGTMTYLFREVARRYGVTDRPTEEDLSQFSSSLIEVQLAGLQSLDLLGYTFPAYLTNTVIELLLREAAGEPVKDHISISADLCQVLRRDCNGKWYKPTSNQLRSLTSYLEGLVKHVKSRPYLEAGSLNCAQARKAKQPGGALALLAQNGMPYTVGPLGGNLAFVNGRKLYTHAGTTSFSAYGVGSHVLLRSSKGFLRVDERGYFTHDMETETLFMVPNCTLRQGASFNLNPSPEIFVVNCRADRILWFDVDGDGLDDAVCASAVGEITWKRTWHNDSTYPVLLPRKTTLVERFCTNGRVHMGRFGSNGCVAVCHEASGGLLARVAKNCSNSSTYGAEHNPWFGKCNGKVVVRELFASTTIVCMTVKPKRVLWLNLKADGSWSGAKSPFMADFNCVTEGIFENAIGNLVYACFTGSQKVIKPQPVPTVAIAEFRKSPLRLPFASLEWFTIYPKKCNLHAFGDINGDGRIDFLCLRKRALPVYPTNPERAEDNRQILFVYLGEAKGGVSKSSRAYHVAHCANADVLAVATLARSGFGTVICMTDDRDSFVSYTLAEPESDPPVAWDVFHDSQEKKLTRWASSGEITISQSRPGPVWGFDCNKRRCSEIRLVQSVADLCTEDSVLWPPYWTPVFTSGVLDGVQECRHGYVVVGLYCASQNCNKLMLQCKRFADCVVSNNPHDYGPYTRSVKGDRTMCSVGRAITGIKCKGFGCSVMEPRCSTTSKEFPIMQLQSFNHGWYQLKYDTECLSPKEIKDGARVIVTSCASPRTVWRVESSFIHLVGTPYCLAASSKSAILKRCDAGTDGEFRTPVKARLFWEMHDPGSAYPGTYLISVWSGRCITSERGSSAVELNLCGVKGYSRVATVSFHRIEKQTTAPTSPTQSPTKKLTNPPSTRATYTPSASVDTQHPINYPTKFPVPYRTSYPSKFPTSRPSTYPSKFPSIYPSKFPSIYPSKYPTPYQTEFPTGS